MSTPQYHAGASVYESMTLDEALALCATWGLDVEASRQTLCAGGLLTAAETAADWVAHAMATSPRYTPEDTLKYVNIEYLIEALQAVWDAHRGRYTRVSVNASIIEGVCHIVFDDLDFAIRILDQALYSNGGPECLAWMLPPDYGGERPNGELAAPAVGRVNSLDERGHDISFDLLVPSAFVAASELDFWGDTSCAYGSSCPNIPEPPIPPPYTIEPAEGETPAWAIECGADLGLLDVLSSEQWDEFIGDNLTGDLSPDYVFDLREHDGEGTLLWVDGRGHWVVICEEKNALVRLL